jgi:hypothetical protein
MNVGAIKADDTRLMKDLGRFIEPVEIYDAQGKMLGLFVPANLERCKQKQAEILAKIDWAEIERRGRDPAECVPNALVLAGLKQLSLESARRQQTGERPLTLDEAKAIMHSAQNDCVPIHVSVPQGNQQ